MTVESSPQQTQKIGSINTLRFIAAMLVVFYHFAFVYYYRDLSYVNVPLLRPLFKYGYLGVDVFFIISGFVISLSAESRGAYNFVKSRIGRLYPVFWISAIVTSLFIFFGGAMIYSHVSWWRFWTNMTMVPTILFRDASIDFLDGSYWTLAVEMKFYIIIFLLLLFKQFKKIENISIGVAVAMLLSAIFFTINPDSQIVWIPNFIAGILFYKIYKNGLSNWRIFGLLTTFTTSLIFTLSRVPILSDGYGVPFHPVSITMYIVLSYVIFLLIALKKFTIPNNKYVNMMGILTYPVYLLHQQIARILFTYAQIKNIPLYYSFPAVFILVIAMAFLIHKFFERRGKIILDKILDKVTPSNLKRL